jgi:IS4 transposase
MFARLLNSGTERVLEGKRYLFGGADTPVPVRVVLRHVGSRGAKSPFLVLATWKVAPGEATELYRRRWEIETMFAALKSRGFDLEATNRTDPRRVERLIGLLALAFSAS